MCHDLVIRAGGGIHGRGDVDHLAGQQVVITGDIAQTHDLIGSVGKVNAELCANAGNGLKVQPWMKPVMKYSVPAIVLILYVYGLITFNW